MKKSLIALAALGAFAGTASAQSSVTLFGILDTGVRFIKNGDGSTTKTLTNDGLSASRIGFRGEEDLGNGLKAGFWIEASVGLDVGSGGAAAGTPGTATGAGGAAATQAAKFFNRRSTISLLGNFGEVRLGRDYTPSFSNLAAFDAYGAVGVGNILNVLGGVVAPFTSASTAAAGLNSVGTLGSNAGTLVRADNSVAYHLPNNIGGVYGTVMAATGEGVNSTNGNNRYVGGRVGWQGGPINVAGAYGRTRIPGNDDFRVWNLGASFTLPVVKVSALYHRADYQPTGLDNRTQKVWAVGVNVPVGQAEIRATYQRSDVGGGGPAFIGLRNEDDARQYAVGAIYNLSKRTALYADVGRLTNRGLSQLAIPGGTNNNFTGGQDSTAFALGVRHSF